MLVIENRVRATDSISPRVQLTAEKRKILDLGVIAPDQNWSDQFFCQRGH